MDEKTLNTISFKPSHLTIYGDGGKGNRFRFRIRFVKGKYKGDIEWITTKPKQKKKKMKVKVI